MSLVSSGSLCSSGYIVSGSGSNHGQADRVINSKVTRSENTAKLYLAHKDHKLEENKTRPIGTANSSNTRGFANSVSDLLEAIANSEKQKYEVISSEDMLHHVKNSNEEVKKMKQEWYGKKRRKDNCEQCKVWKSKCSKHHPTERSQNHEEFACRAPEEETENPTEEPAEEKREQNPTEEPVDREEVAYKAYVEETINELIEEIIEETVCEECCERRDNTREQN